MVLLLALAADAVVGAVRSGGQWRLVLAGVWVGLAFQAKMIEAWLVLPALAVTYLVAGPGTRWTRARHVAVGGVVTAAVSLAWMLAVTLVPAGARPHVDGSTGESLFEQVFVYNGFGRIGQASPLQVLAGQGLALAASPPPGWGRLFVGDLGRDCGWLLPLGVVVAVAGIVATRGRTRTDPVRAGYLLWGTWLVCFAGAFSVISTINSYYTAALAPAVAALCGIGVVDVWRRRESATTRVMVMIVVAGTVVYAAFLLQGAGASVPGWLVPALVAVAAVALLLLLVSALRRTDTRLLSGGLAAAVLAVPLVPAVASTALVLRGQGAFDTPFEPAAAAAGVDRLFVETPAEIAETLPGLERARAGAPDLLAVQSSAVASMFAYPTGDQVLPIGGFTGTQPSPTLDELRADIASGRFHLVLTFPSSDPRLVWIARHCRPLNRVAPPFHDYFCVPADAASTGSP
jgi:4-amino-4-deoxy-L-arabinose transferase-like glycosyltransferase